MTKKLTFQFLKVKKISEKTKSPVHNALRSKIGKMMDNQIFNQPTQPLRATETLTPAAPLIYAGFWTRFVAHCIDALFTAFLGGMLGFLTGTDAIISLSTSAVVSIIYTAIFDSSELMGTPGKAMLGIAVVTEKSQNRISFQTAIVRFLCKYLSYVVLMIGYLVQPFTDKRQTFHDIVSNTIVIKKDLGQLSYWNSFKENFNKILNN